MANTNRGRAKVANAAKKPGTSAPTPGGSTPPPGATPISRKRVRRAVTHRNPATSLTVLRHGMQHMRHSIFLTLAVLLGLGIVLSFGMINLPKAYQGDTGEVAQINKHTIQRAEFEAAAQRAADSPYLMMMGGGPTQALFLRNMLLEQETERYLKLDAAKREGNRVGRKQLQDRINQMLDSQIQQMAAKYKSDKEFVDYLKRKQQVNSREEFRRKLQGQITDQTTAAISEEILLENLQKTVEARGAKQPITGAKPEDLELKARQILVKIDPKKRNEAAAQKQAQDLVAKIKGGEDFAKVARENSEDEMTKAKGGDLGWAGKNTFYPTQLADAAYALKDNQVSDPIKTPSGFYILRVEGRRFSPSRYWQTYVDDLKKKAKITIHDPALLAFKKATDLQTGLSKKQAEAKDDAARKKVEEERAKVNQQTIALFEKALPQVTTSEVRAAMLYQIGALQNQLHNTAKAAEAFGSAASTKPMPETYVSLGDAQVELKKNDAAVESYQNAAAMTQEYTPQNQGTHVRLQSAFQGLNRTDLAAKEKAWLDEYKKQNPGGGMMFPGMGGNVTVR